MVEVLGRWGGNWLAAEIEQQLELLKELWRQLAEAGVPEKKTTKDSPSAIESLQK